MSDVASEEWTAMAGWYEILIDKCGWQQEPMLEFVRWLAASEYATRLHPSQSHHWLGLSLVRDYSERRMQRIVFIGYADNEFDVSYLERVGGKTARFEKVRSPREPAVLERIEAWLTSSE